MGIEHRRADVPMSEEFLQSADVIAMFQERCGKPARQGCRTIGGAPWCDRQSTGSPMLSGRSSVPSSNIGADGNSARPLCGVSASASGCRENNISVDQAMQCAADGAIPYRLPSTDSRARSGHPAGHGDRHHPRGTVLVQVLWRCPIAMRKALELRCHPLQSLSAGANAPLDLGHLQFVEKCLEARAWGQGKDLL